MAQRKSQPDIQKLSFEDALGELEGIVRDLESGTVKLDKAIEAYERGAALKAHCQAKLHEAQAKIDRIGKQADGTVSAEPANFC
jgi:exodeoxyribonuclease VII small subunit